jgi:hypothetical protein
MRKLLTFLISLGAIVLSLWLAVSPLYAGSMTLLGVGSAPISGTPFGITYVSENSLVSSTASFSFAAQPIGTADPTRLTCVTATWIGTGVTITSLTIGGNAATQVSGALSNSDTSGQASDIWCLGVPTGTTATIAYTLSASTSRSSIQVYSVIGTGAAVSTGTSAFSSTTVATLTKAATIPAGGGAIAVVNVHSASASAFSGTNLTLDNQLVVGSATVQSGHNSSSSGSTTLALAGPPLSTPRCQSRHSTRRCETARLPKPRKPDRSEPDQQHGPC